METQLPQLKGAQQLPHFSAHVYCSHTVAHISYCRALDLISIGNIKMLFRL